MDQVLLAEQMEQEKGIVQQQQHDGAGQEQSPVTLDKELDQVKETFSRFGTSLSSLWGNVKKQASLITAGML
jgi:peptidoglycan hydrolase CwlO-like protein